MTEPACLACFRHGQSFVPPGNCQGSLDALSAAWSLFYGAELPLLLQRDATDCAGSCASDFGVELDLSSDSITTDASTPAPAGQMSYPPGIIPLNGAAPLTGDERRGSMDSGASFSPSNTKKSPRKYRKEEDERILEFVRNLPAGACLSSPVVWKTAVERSVADRSWQSMKDHYLKILEPEMKGLPHKRLSHRKKVDASTAQRTGARRVRAAAAFAASAAFHEAASLPLSDPRVPALPAIREAAVENAQPASAPGSHLPSARAGPLSAHPIVDARLVPEAAAAEQDDGAQLWEILQALALDATGDGLWPDNHAAFTADTAAMAYW